MSGMVSRCKHLSKRRDCKQAKDAERLAPKGDEGGRGAECSPLVNTHPSGE
jgi:hypothetical protein